MALPAKSSKPVHNRRPYAFRARRRAGRGSPGGRRCAKEDEPGRSPARGAGGRLREYRARARCASCWVFGAWQVAHVPSRLASSSVPPSATGMMWSIWVAVPVQLGPRFSHWPRHRRMTAVLSLRGTPRGRVRWLLWKLAMEVSFPWVCERPGHQVDVRAQRFRVHPITPGGHPGISPGHYSFSRFLMRRLIARCGGRCRRWCRPGARTPCGGVVMFWRGGGLVFGASWR